MNLPIDDTRRFAPAAARNRDPIRDLLLPALPARGLVLEIASGSGEHTMHIASASPPDLTFQPSDPDPSALASIDAWLTHLGLGNVRPALALDASSESWPVAQADTIICINMIHIAPWKAAEGLMRGARRLLPAGGLLYLYGPFRRDGHHTSPGNAAFDLSLRAENPDWGVRDFESVSALATANGFGAPAITQMPANNLSLFFRRLA
jgi:SAM-dependent methyltransferase